MAIEDFIKEDIMIRIYDALEFDEIFHHILFANEAVNQLIIGNMSEVKKQIRNQLPVKSGVLFAVLFRNEEPAYFVCNYPPYNMVITAVDSAKQDKESADALAGELIEWLSDHALAYSGINAPKLFAEAFIEKSRDQFEKDVFLGIMTAAEIKDIPLVPGGVMRRMRPDEAEMMSEFYQQFAEDALHEIISLEEARENVQHRMLTRGEHMWVYEIDGEVVASAECSRETELGASIGFVFTRREKRGNGYCKQLMSWISRRYMDHGHEYVTLYVDMDNPCSTRAYLYVGYKVVDLAFAYKKLS